MPSDEPHPELDLSKCFKGEQQLVYVYLPITCDENER
jgi:hypothetical protein